MDNIVTLSGEDLRFFYANVIVAYSEERDLHITTGSDRYGPWVKVKVGGGMWSPALR